jgi:hypothetical protein
LKPNPGQMTTRSLAPLAAKPHPLPPPPRTRRAGPGMFQPDPPGRHASVAGTSSSRRWFWHWPPRWRCYSCAHKAAANCSWATILAAGQHQSLPRASQLEPETPPCREVVPARETVALAVVAEVALALAAAALALAAEDPALAAADLALAAVAPALAAADLALAAAAPALAAADLALATAAPALAAADLALATAAPVLAVADLALATAAPALGVAALRLAPPHRQVLAAAPALHPPQPRVALDPHHSREQPQHLRTQPRLRPGRRRAATTLPRRRHSLVRRQTPRFRPP